MVEIYISLSVGLCLEWQYKSYFERQRLKLHKNHVGKKPFLHIGRNWKPQCCILMLQ